ncbi:MAG: hypothetical protein NC114_08870 [Ruminococcus flavefaciens]|nr:hypothetical protein [Ruminococcus flavefaciens]
MENYLDNYIDAVTTVEEFKHGYPELAEQAEKAKEYLKGRYPNADEKDFIVINVESYNCIAAIVEDGIPYTLDEIIAPFDKNTIYPIQGLVTKFAFKRY